MSCFISTCQFTTTALSSINEEVTTIDASTGGWPSRPTIMLICLISNISFRFRIADGVDSVLITLRTKETSPVLRISTSLSLSMLAIPKDPVRPRSRSNIFPKSVITRYTRIMCLRMAYTGVVMTMAVSLRPIFFKLAPYNTQNWVRGYLKKFSKSERSIIKTRRRGKSNRRWRPFYASHYMYRTFLRPEG